MAIVLGRHLFGIPEIAPEITGYEVIMRPNRWVKARKDGQEFFVADAGGSWELHQALQDDDFKGPGNPLGEYMDTRHPIFIQK